LTVKLHTDVDILIPVVKLKDGPGYIELSQSNEFSLGVRDPATNACSAPIILLPVNQLTVRGDRSMLTFDANGIRKTVDFSLASRTVGWVGGIGGAIGQAAVLKRTDIDSWITALRELGVTVKYRSVRRYYLTWSLGAFLFLVAIVVGFAILANAVTYRG
jgi:hypothetical protein